MSDSSDFEWERIVECLPQMAWVAYPNGAAQCVNRLMLRYTGRNQAAHQGWGWLDLIHEEDVTVAREGWAKAVAGGKVLDSEIRIRGYDGVYRWHAVRASPMHDNSGEIQRWIGITTNIEAARTFERSLVEAVGAPEEVDAVLTALQAAAPLAIGFVNSDFRITHANAELASIDPEAAAARIGKHIAEALPTLWPQIEPICLRVMESRGPIGNVTVVGGAPGKNQIHQWLVTCYAVEERTQVVGVGIIAVDVTELSQVAETRSAILSRVADGVIAADVDGRVVYLNGAASTMLGWTPEEANGRPLGDFIRQASGAALDASVVTSRASISQSGRGECTREDGSILFVAFSAVPFGRGIVPDRVVVVFREVSEPRTPSAPIRLLIVDAHPLVGEALALLLANEDGMTVVGRALSSEEGIAAAQSLSPDVVLVDADLPDNSGLSTASVITAEVPNANVILVTSAYDAQVLSDALEAGCAWVLEKTDGLRAILSAARSAYAGETRLSRRELESVLPQAQIRPREPMELLTPREREVLRLISEGLSNRVIAEELGVTANTVRNHVQRILFKLNVHSKLEAIVFAHAHQPVSTRPTGETAAEPTSQHPVQQAARMAAEQLGVSVTHALNTLAALAARQGRPLAAVAQDVTDHRMRFDTPASS